MKAAILNKLNSPLSICNIELPEPSIGQVLVKVLVSGLCGSQLQEIYGNKGNEKFLPHLMGHEGCGIVEKIGPGVSTVKVGDKVVMHWRQGLGIESEFPLYTMDGKTYTCGKITTLSEKVLVSENRVTAISKDVNNELAALLGCSLTTALSTLEKLSNLMFGESVAILGCGGVGLNLIMAAKLRGAGHVYAIEQNESKKKICLSQGANNFLTNIQDLGTKVDLIIDTTGIPNLISSALNFLSNDGRFILIGQPNPKATINIENAVHLFSGQGKSLIASQGGRAVPHFDIPRYLQLIESSGIDATKIVTHRYNLTEINLALDELKSGNAGRVMIKMSGGIK